jgi:translation elongation factor P/translation initiation factor 5A
MSLKGKGRQIHMISSNDNKETGRFLSDCRAGTHRRARQGLNGRHSAGKVPGSHDSEVPLVERKDYYLISIEGVHTQLLDFQHSSIREDVNMSDSDVCHRLRELWELGEAEEIIVTVITFRGESEIIEVRAS